jgi:hypothetical protein
MWWYFAHYCTQTHYNSNQVIVLSYRMWFQPIHITLQSGNSLTLPLKTVHLPTQIRAIYVNLIIYPSIHQTMSTKTDWPTNPALNPTAVNQTWIVLRRPSVWFSNQRSPTLTRVSVVFRTPMKIMAQSLTIVYGHLLTNYLPVNTNLRNVLYYNIKFLQLKH